MWQEAGRGWGGVGPGKCFWSGWGPAGLWGWRPWPVGGLPVGGLPVGRPGGRRPPLTSFLGLRSWILIFVLAFLAAILFCFLVALKVTPHRGIEPTMRFLELLSCRRDRVERDYGRRGYDRRDYDRRGYGRRGYGSRCRLWRLSLA